MDIKTEIRKISPGKLFTLIQILEYDESWKKLMAIIPKTLTLINFDCNIAINNLPKYNTEHFKLIENAGYSKRKSCSEILFEEWGTSGRIRPRLGHLLRLLKKAELYRAADYVAVKLLNIAPPERPESGPAAKIDIHLSESFSNFFTSTNEDVERILDDINYPSSILNQISIPDNNIAENNYVSKRIIPKIIVNDMTSNTTNISSETENANIGSNSTNSSQVQENMTESTDVENNNSNSSVSDMIIFSESRSQMPAISSLLNNSPEVENYIQSNDSEAYNSDIPNISSLIQSEIPEIPNLSSLIQSERNSTGNLMNKQVISRDIRNDSTGLPAFSQIMSSENNVPAFSQILPASEENIQIKSSNALPQFSQLISAQLTTKEEIVCDNNIVGMPHLSELMAYEEEKRSLELTYTDPQSTILPNLSVLQLDKPSSSEITRKISLSPVNSVSRSTCVSPLPNLSLNTVLPQFSYNELDIYTNGFDENMLSSHHSVYINEPSGRKLGSGAFGSVYLALGLLDKPVAVKKLNLHGVNVVNIDDTITKQFRNEVELLCKYKHENLLSLLGYSCDGPTYCLIYEYICGGALKDRLQSLENRLIWTNRLYIALGTSRAVSYLHNAYSMPLIHRDIKSANILLDNSDKPKLCDFGLIKLTPNQNTITSTTVFGTSAYMAPEAFRGDVSVKLDTFSFGVVLLELLTALPPLDENREGNDLVTHVEEICDDNINPLLDLNAGNWRLKGINFGEELYKIATQCLEEKKRRLLMATVVDFLSELIEKAK